MFNFFSNIIWRHEKVNILLFLESGTYILVQKRRLSQFLFYISVVFAKIHKKVKCLLFFQNSKSKEFAFFVKKKTRQNLFMITMRGSPVSPTVFSRRKFMQGKNRWISHRNFFKIFRTHEVRSILVKGLGPKSCKKLWKTTKTMEINEISLFPLDFHEKVLPSRRLARPPGSRVSGAWCSFACLYQS